MENINHKKTEYTRYPEKILQIGEGNFLRCFIGWQVDILNEKNNLNAGIVVARPIDTEMPPSLNAQAGLYTTMLRGYDEQGDLRNEKRVISAVIREISIYKEYDEFIAIAHNPDLRFIFSNTTEAGIIFNDQDDFGDTPPVSYPAKLTRFLFERFNHFNGSSESGFIILPCELIDYNGEELKRIILQYIKLWNLSGDFCEWIETANTFCSTLVDRIVTGYPHDEAEELQKELGYKDQFMVTGEYFHLFVIQGPQFVADELKIAGSGLNIEIVDDLKPYKERKVGILNGSHTALVPVAYLSGIELVKDAVSEPLLEKYLAKLLDEEIIPSLGMPVDYLEEFAKSVIGRFKNPFINHKLLDISLNSMTKFKTRLLPQFLAYYKNNSSIPPLMSLSLAALICFYKGESNGKKHVLKDDQYLLDLYADLWDSSELTQDRAKEIAGRVLELEDHWGISLLSLDGLLEKVAADIFSIMDNGMEETLKGYL